MVTQNMLRTHEWIFFFGENNPIFDCFRSYQKSPNMHPLLWYLPPTQNIPIPENSCPCETFCCGCPYEEKDQQNRVLLPLRAL